MNDLTEAINKALLTWYPEDHKLHFDNRHPAIKLAGEAGEVLDLFGKHEYKPGFDWWDCKHCKDNRSNHSKNSSYCPGWWNIENESERTGYTSLVLDELGDLWYYIRILAYQNGQELKYAVNVRETIVKSLVSINLDAAQLCNNVIHKGSLNKTLLDCVFTGLFDVLQFLDSGIDQLTELNYIKLNSDATAHGWKNA